MKIRVPRFGLTSILTARPVMTPKGPNVICVEIQGRTATLGAALDAGRPTEVGQ